MAHVRFTADGQVLVDGREIPNTGMRFEKRPDAIGQLTIDLPVFDVGEVEGEVELVFIASLDPLTEHRASGPTVAAALRALADAIEAS